MSESSPSGHEVNRRNPQHSNMIPVGPAGVHLDSIENAIDGVRWPLTDHDNINLAEIQQPYPRRRRLDYRYPGPGPASLFHPEVVSSRWRH
jgi:hypothetical protein